MKEIAYILLGVLVSLIVVGAHEIYSKKNTACVVSESYEYVELIICLK